MAVNRERAPWWGVQLPPVEGNAPDVRPAIPAGLWDNASGTFPRVALPPVGRPPLPLAVPPRRTGRRGLLWAVGGVAALIGAAVGGVVGGVVGAATTGNHGGAASTSLTNPSFTLPVSEPSVARVTPAGSVAAIAAAVLPSVVTVHIRNSSEAGTGAGVIISSDGYILTNNHVVTLDAKGSGTLTVDLSAARTNVSARIVGRSPLDDLAVIKVDVAGLPAARLGRSGALQVGDLVVAVGAPLGLSGSVTSGIVSALARNIEVPSDDGTVTTLLGNAIQTDAAINPGNSGGALVDADGSVVGINSAIASTDTTSESGPSGSIGVGFAIPIDYARAIAEEIIQTGKATHAYLGVVTRTLDPITASRDQPAYGALITSVAKGAPADLAGLTAGDVITSVNGQLVTSSDDLIGATRSHRIGETVAVGYVRKGTSATAQITLARSPSE